MSERLGEGPFYGKDPMARLQELVPEDREVILDGLAAVYEMMVTTLKDIPDDQLVPLGAMLLKMGEKLELDDTDPYWQMIDPDGHQLAGEVREMAQAALIELGRPPAEPPMVFDGERRHGGS